MDVQMPDGTIVTGVPENMTQSELLSRYKAYADTAPAPTAEKEGALYGVAANITPSLATGIGALMQFPGQIADLVTGTAPGEKAGIGRTVLGSVIPFGQKGIQEAGQKLQEIGREAKTIGLKEKERERAEKIAASEGELNKFGTAFAETITDPALTYSFLFEQLPNALGGGIGGLLTKVGGKMLFKNATQTTLNGMGVTGAVVTGAAQQGADIGYDTYKDIYEQLVKDGMKPEEANLIAAQKGRVAAAEAGALSYATSRIPGAREFEKALFKGSRSALPAAGAQGVGKSIAKGVIGGGISETAEETGGTFISNVGKQEVFPETELTGGLGEAAAMALIGGPIMEGAAGGINARSQALALKRLQDQAAQTPETAGLGAPDLTSPVVATTRTTTDGKESVRTRRADGSVDVDGVMVIPPTAPPAQVAQTEDVQGELPGEPAPAQVPTPVAQAAQPSAEDIVPLDDKGEPVKTPESIAAPKEVLDPNIEAQLAAEPPDVESMIPNYPAPPKAEKAPRVPKEDRPPRVMYGVDVDGNLNVPVADGGLPFKTKVEAAAAKKLQPGFRVMQTKDGFFLAEKTEKEIAADQIKAQRLQQPPEKILAAHEFIASLGGLNKKEASEIDPDAAKKNVRIGNKFFYSPKGMTIAEAAEKLREAGYTESESSNEAYQILQDSFADPVYSIYDADAIAEQRFAERDAELAEQAQKKESEDLTEAADVGRENAEFRDYLVLERELGDPVASMVEAGYTPAELQEAGFMNASLDLQTEVAALQDLATPENIDALDIIDSLDTTGQAAQEKVNAEEQAIASAIQEATKPGGRADVGKADETEGVETKEPVKTSALTAAKPPADTTEVLVSRPPKNATVAQPPVNPTWESLPDMTAKDTLVIRLFDKHQNLNLLQRAIAKAGGELKQELDAYTTETLSHGRIERQWSDFLVGELDPVLKEMLAKKVSDDQLTEYLVMRHAKEANDLIAERNPDNPAKQDNGVGVTYKEREEYFENLSPERKKAFESIAKKVDGILVKTRDMLEQGGVISPEDRKAWEEMFEFYIPTRREESDFMLPSSSYRRVGDFAKSRTGSSKKVVDVLANIAINREIAINRIEKERIYRSVYGLSVMYPNTDYWKAIVPEAYKSRDELANELVDMFDIDRTDANDMAELIFNEPSREYFDKQAGVVRNRIDSSAKYKDYVLPVKMDGKDRFVFFNPKNARAAQTVQSLRGLDVPQLRGVLAAVAPITRFFSAINTQYNLIFGAFNFLRDVQGAQFNLSTTPIADRKVAVLKGTFKAIPEIYTAIRERNAGKPFSDTSDGSWDDFTKHGGKVGYKDQFAKVNESVNVIEKKLKELDRSGLKQFAFDVKDWVSNANDVLENAVRVSTYREALDKFKSEYKGEIPARELENMKAKAANIAKNITVNFNRKGTAGVTAGALYAFFNASAQGTAKLYETLKGPLGKKIVAGGIALGIAQAVWLAMAGFDEDEPTEFIKQKNLIFPTGDGKYVMWPMPFGFNVFPNIGRLLTETVMKTARGQNVSDKLFDTITMLANAFNPLGGGGLAQMMTPTVADPLMALFENRDAFGRPISRENRGTSPKPGYTLSRDPSPSINQYLAEFINNVSFGNKDKRGWVSPTADQLDYLAGQATGGVGREVLKIGKAAKNLVTGEETQVSQVPVKGKIIGDINSPQAISQRFYNNVKTMSEHQDAIKGRIDRRENVSAYMRDNPESVLWRRANRLENDITKLNTRRRDLIKQDAPYEQIKRLDDQKTRMMKQFNDQVRKYN